LDTDQIGGGMSRACLPDRFLRIVAQRPSTARCRPVARCDRAHAAMPATAYDSVIRIARAGRLVLLLPAPEPVPLMGDEPGSDPIDRFVIGDHHG